MEVLNEYGAVKYFGVNTYTTGIFRAWLSMGDVGTAIQLSIILLIVVFSFFYIEKYYHSKIKFNYKTNSKIQSINKLIGVNKFFAILICSIPFLFGFLIPLLFILNNVFLTYSSVDFNDLFRLTYNSISVSSIASFLIITISPHTGFNCLPNILAKPTLASFVLIFIRRL